MDENEENSFKKREINEHINSLTDFQSADEYACDLKTYEEKVHAMKAICKKFKCYPERLFTKELLLKVCDKENCYDKLVKKQEQRENSLSQTYINEQKKHINNDNKDDNGDDNNDDDNDGGLSTSPVLVPTK